MPKILVQALMVLLIFLSGHARAANYSNPIDGVFKGIYGDTIAIEVPSLVSKSPVSNADQNGDLSFQINSDTGYRRFSQLTDLKYGDPVRIEYNEDPSGKKKQMVASIITKLESEITANPVNVADTNPAPAPTVTQTVVTTTTRVNQ